MNHIEMMRLAEGQATLSVCKRAQVGAVIEWADGTYSFGYNQHCDDPQARCEGADGRTLPTVVHAERDAIEWLAEPCKQSGSVLYVTRQPCIDCARLIVDAGIHAVYYRDADDKKDGLEYLRVHGVEVDSGWITGRVADSWAERNGVAG